jgi:carbonic anhydrase
MPEPEQASQMLTRRRLLQLCGSGMVLGTAGLAAWAWKPRSGALDQLTPAVKKGSDYSPADVLDLLAQGNARFVRGEHLAPNRNLERMKEVAGQQAPFAAFLGCADSRVPIEIVFDQGFGDLFVTRIAGNVANPEIIGSLEFGTAVLGAKVIYVLGHTSCGAVAAAVRGAEVPGQISTLFQHLRPAVRPSGGDLDRAIHENVRFQATLVAESSPVIARLVREGRVRVAGGVYDLQSGVVSPVQL